MNHIDKGQLFKEKPQTWLYEKFTIIKIHIVLGENRIKFSPKSFMTLCQRSVSIGIGHFIDKQKLFILFIFLMANTAFRISQQ